jgi:uncharacterized protein YydD (DUF2326 family)
LLDGTCCRVQYAIIKKMIYDLNSKKRLMEEMRKDWMAYADERYVVLTRKLEREDDLQRRRNPILYGQRLLI